MKKYFSVWLTPQVTSKY